MDKTLQVFFRNRVLLLDWVCSVIHDVASFRQEGHEADSQDAGTGFGEVGFADFEQGEGGRDVHFFVEKI